MGKGTCLCRLGEDKDLLKVTGLLIQLAGLVVLIILWLSSYTHHTGVGIDHDFQRGDRMLRTYSRISWTGYGSLWFGYGSRWLESKEIVKPENFDLAAVFFRRVTKPLASPAHWNRLGFWYIDVKQPKPAFWVGIPSWLPVLAMSGFWWLRRRFRT